MLRIVTMKYKLLCGLILFFNKMGRYIVISYYYAINVHLNSKCNINQMENPLYSCYTRLMPRRVRDGRWHGRALMRVGYC
jgi:hypothetical protein